MNQTLYRKNEHKNAFDYIPLDEATCDNCGTVFTAVRRRYYCEHCNEYFHVCQKCRTNTPKCRLCGISLKRKGEPL